jgi:hypothetical protein
MAGAIDKGHQSYNDFNSGASASQAPLSTIDKKMLDFAIKVSRNPVIKTHGQILRNFGMYPPEFWTRAQKLSDHPEIDPQTKEQLSNIFSEPSRPGPMTGGAPININGKQFSHGLEW